MFDLAQRIQTLCQESVGDNTSNLIQQNDRLKTHLKELNDELDKLLLKKQSIANKQIPKIKNIKIQEKDQSNNEKQLNILQKELKHLQRKEAQFTEENYREKLNLILAEKQ